ncbi:MAG: GNAT family N-acetyltransferase [Candidatus Tyrphobacter sp.]
MTLVVPSVDRLASYAGALERGWSPDTHRPERAREELDEIARDVAAFFASLDDPLAAGPPIRLRDGSLVPRLPGFHRWMWDGEFCGDIGLRWVPGTACLPDTCPGHIGYGVVPWKRGRTYATRALALLLPMARDVGLPHVDLVTEPDNDVSQRVILANGGTLVERFTRPAHLGGTPALRFRILLS